MKWRNWIPGAGDKKVRKRIREIENIELGFPVLLSSSVMKTYESVVAGNIQMASRWLLAVVCIFSVYVYYDDLKEKAEEVKDEI